MRSISSLARAWVAASTQSRACGALNMPAQPQADSLDATLWGAESVPRKKQSSPDEAAATSARRSDSRFKTGKQ